MTRACVSATTFVSTATNCRRTASLTVGRRAGWADAPTAKTVRNAVTRSFFISGPHHVFAAFILRLEHGEEAGRLQNNAGEKVLLGPFCGFILGDCVLVLPLGDDLSEREIACEDDTARRDEGREVVVLHSRGISR